MDTRTGEIVSGDFVKTLQEQKKPEANFFKKIPDPLLAEMQGMNRKQRREYYRKNKKRFI